MPSVVLRSNKFQNKTKTNANEASDLKKTEENTPVISLKSVFFLAFIFLSSLLYFYMIYLQFPSLEENEKKFIKLPKNMLDARQLGIVLKKYSNDHFYTVFLTFFSAYVFLQTFAIPGSIFLTILAGFLYEFPLAISVVCICSTLGASFCYAISFIVARKLVYKYLRERVSKLQNEVEKHRGNIFYYIVFLRITPFVPNWFMNLTSPLIDIPLIPFALGTFVGQAPPSCFYVQAGRTIQTLTSSTDVFTLQSVLTLAFFSIIALLPVFFKNQLKKKVE